MILQESFLLFRSNTEIFKLKTMKQVGVGIIMGSSSDAPIMRQAIEGLKKN